MYNDRQTQTHSITPWLLENKISKQRHVPQTETISNE